MKDDIKKIEEGTSEKIKKKSVPTTRKNSKNKNLQLQIRVSPIEMKKLKKFSKLNHGGNVSEYIRHMAIYQTA